MDRLLWHKLEILVVVRSRFSGSRASFFLFLEVYILPFISFRSKMRPLDLKLHFHVVKPVPSIKSNDFESEVWKVKTWFGWNQICNKEVGSGLRDGGLAG